MTTKLNLITKTFEGASVRAVDHPEHGELLHAVDVLKVLGHPASAGAAPFLAKYGIPKEERVLLGSADTLTDGVSSISNGRAAFLTRSAVTRVLMGSTLPKAQAFRDWLAGDVVNAIVDTGGYLLNEAVRDTAKADTRTSVPLPEEIGGAYAALIEARKAELEARMGELKALEAAATEAAEKRALRVKLMEAEAVAASERGRAERLAHIQSTAQVLFHPKARMVSALSEKGLYRVAMRSEKGDATATYSFRISASGRSHEFPVRIVPIDGEPWFVATDVVAAISMSKAGTVYSAVSSADKRMLHKGDSISPGGFRWSRANRLLLLSESGLYKLIMRSDKPEARSFQDWLAREVLPSIRKTSGYMLQGADRSKIAEGETSEMPDVAGLMGRIKALEETLTAQQAAMEARINDQVARILVEIGRASAAAVRGIAAHLYGDDYHPPQEYNALFARPSASALPYLSFSSV